MEEEDIRKKYISPEQALVKITRWCAYQERNQQETRDKLYTYGLHKDQVETIISTLIIDNFLNEERFAIAYAGGKFRISKWGKAKIIAALKQKRISDFCIRKAMQQIDDKQYKTTIRTVLQKRSKQVKEKDAFKRKYKLMQYAISRGFDANTVNEVIKELSNE